MKTALIALDNWKLPIFERHLASNGYTYTKTDGVTLDTSGLVVSTENVEALAVVVRAANTDCALTGRPKA